MIRRLVIGGGVVAGLGLLQYATGQLFVDRLQIPGLTSGTSGWSLAQRSGLARPSGTSTHPIEFGVVLTMVLPLAIVYAIRSPSRRWIYRILLGAISFAIFLSISRSALVCAGVALLVLAASWTAAARVRALMVLLMVTAAIYLCSSGSARVPRAAVRGKSDDPSITSRTGSYDLALRFIQASPILGRGFGTFLPKYWILDNGYLGRLFESGIGGLLGLLVLIAGRGVAARRARLLVVEEFDQAIAQALFASVAAAAFGLAFFDTFGFPQWAGCFSSSSASPAPCGV